MEKRVERSERYPTCVGQEGPGRFSAHAMQIWAAILVLVMVHLAMFSSHYAGSAVFPWDFLGGYHAHAVAWYADGSFFDPPKWMSWGDAGFPVYWALQSGAFYLPLQILDWIDIPYSIVNAVRLQSLHVLMGTLGALALLRAMGFSVGWALLGALGYHFSVVFYANQQHVDIVRAAALLPWLIWAFLPHVILRSEVRPPLAALILFQFLVGAYPGNVVTAVYTLATVMGVFVVLRRTVWPDGGSVSISRVLAAVSLVVAAGASMSLLKWLPPFVEGDWATGSHQIVSAPPSVLTTLVYSYDVPFLPLDLTVRSLWLPLPLVLGMLYTRRWDAPAILGTILTALSLLLAFAPPIIDGVSLPGFGISRFPVTDWRPTLHLGLILAACAGWRDRVTLPMVHYRGDVLFLICLVALIAAGLIQGYGVLEAGVVLLVGAACLFAAFARRFASGRVALIALQALTAVEGTMYHGQEARVWNRPWDRAMENVVFGPDYAGPQALKDRRDIALDRRPARVAVGRTYDDIIANSLSSQYNTCFYQGVFCLLGYNNLRMSRSNREMKKAIRDPQSGPALVDFLMRPQSLAAFHPKASVTLDGLDWDGPEDQVAAGDGVIASVTSFGETQVRYSISVSTPMLFVENETWESGWTGQLCASGGRDCRRLVVDPSLGFLRSWTVPAGSWDVAITFEVPSMKWAWLAFAIGVFLTVGSSLAPCGRKIIGCRVFQRSERAA